MATRSSVLACRIPRTEEPGRLQSMGSQSWIRPSDHHLTCMVIPGNTSKCFPQQPFFFLRSLQTVLPHSQSLSTQLGSVLFSRSVVSDSLWPHESQHARPPCPSPTPGAHPNSCPSSWWCHPAISSSVVPFSSCLQSFPASRSFQMSQLFTSGGQSIGASASASVLPMNIQDWFPLGWTDWISLQSKGLSRVFSGN